MCLSSPGCFTQPDVKISSYNNLVIIKHNERFENQKIQAGNLHLCEGGGLIKIGPGTHIFDIKDSNGGINVKATGKHLKHFFINNSKSFTTASFSTGAKKKPLTARGT